MMEVPEVRVYAYRHQDAPYTVKNPDLSPLPIDIDAGLGFSIMVRADTGNGPKVVAVRIEHEQAASEMVDRLAKKMSYPLVREDIPILPREEIERRILADDLAGLDAHRDRIRQREAQYVSVIKDRMVEALAVA